MYRKTVSMMLMCSVLFVTGCSAIGLPVRPSEESVTKKVEQNLMLMHGVGNIEASTSWLGFPSNKDVYVQFCLVDDAQTVQTFRNVILSINQHTPESYVAVHLINNSDNGTCNGLTAITDGRASLVDLASQLELPEDLLPRFEDSYMNREDFGRIANSL